MGIRRMVNKNIIYIATVIIIIIMVSGAFLYVNYKTPNQAKHTKQHLSRG